MKSSRYFFKDEEEDENIRLSEAEASLPSPHRFVEKRRGFRPRLQAATVPFFLGLRRMRRERLRIVSEG